MRKCVSVVVVLLLSLLPSILQAGQQSASELFYSMRQKLDVVKDYEATVKMKIDVSYMKIPQLSGKLYFKAPDKMKLERNGGISIMPRKSISLTLNTLVPTGGVTVIDAGIEIIAGKTTRVLKVVPDDDKTDIVLTKIWVDEERMLALRTETTTKDNGTVKMDLEFGKYLSLGLPDRVTFYVDVKDYKLPKGVTMDYEATDKPLPDPATQGKTKKGKIQITYLNYQVNKGLSDAIFAEKKK